MGARGRNFYNDLARRYGYEKEAAEIQELYLGGSKEEAAALVPDEFLELTSLVGPRSWVAERIAAMRRGGRDPSAGLADPDRGSDPGQPHRSGKGTGRIAADIRANWTSPGGAEYAASHAADRPRRSRGVALCASDGRLPDRRQLLG